MIVLLMLHWIGITLNAPDLYWVGWWFLMSVEIIKLFINLVGLGLKWAKK